MLATHPRLAASCSVPWTLMPSLDSVIALFTCTFKFCAACSRWSCWLQPLFTTWSHLCSFALHLEAITSYCLPLLNILLHKWKLIDFVVCWNRKSFKDESVKTAGPPPIRVEILAMLLVPHDKIREETKKAKQNKTQLKHYEPVSERVFQGVFRTYQLQASKLNAQRYLPVAAKKLIDYQWPTWHGLNGNALNCFALFHEKGDSVWVS